MPELTFTTRWPDGRRLETYSPSLVVHDHLEAGRSYPARWGHPCTAAQASLTTIRRVAAEQPEGVVTVESLDPPVAR